MRVFGGLVQRRAIDRRLPRHPSIPDIADRQAAETRRRGSLPATLSTQRHILREDQTAIHRRLGASGLPVLAIWGENDRIIPRSALGRMAQANRAARQVVVPQAGHSLPWTHLGEVMDAFLTFQHIRQ